MKRAATPLLLWIILCLLACSRSGKSPAPPAEKEGSASQVAVRQVLYDHPRPDSPPGVRIKLLIDSSASMAGFRASLPQLVRAVDQGISYSQDLYFRVESKQTCSFSQTIGVSCRNGIYAGGIATATGYTNLDRAVTSAADSELAIILTDGIPSGRASESGCVASGVDAGCVADALSGAVQGAAGTVHEKMRGAWLVPILTHYSGTYFSEQPVSPRDFNLGAAETNVHQSLGVNVQIRRARRGSDGNLLFEYSGPRYLVALVVGDVEPSRAFLQEFFSHTGFSQVAVIAHPDNYRGGSAVLPPVELFPNSMPPQAYARCGQQTDARGRVVGDLVNCSAIALNRFRMSCRSKPSKGIVWLAPAAASNAVPITLLAPVTFGFSGNGPISRITFGSSASPEVLSAILSAELNCNAERPIQCGSPGSLVRLTSTADFATAIAEIRKENTSTARFMRSVSTDNPAEEPHKIYGLADLLENFYRRKLPDPQTTFSALEFCQE